MFTMLAPTTRPTVPTTRPKVTPTTGGSRGQQLVNTGKNWWNSAVSAVWDWIQHPLRGIVGHNSWTDHLITNIDSSKPRTITAVIVAIIVAVILEMSKHKLLGIVGFFGGFWIGWGIANFFAAKPVALFPGQPTFGHMISAIVAGWPGLIAVLTASAFAVKTFFKAKPKRVRLEQRDGEHESKVAVVAIVPRKLWYWVVAYVAGISVWSATMLIFSAVLAKWYGSKFGLV